MFEKLRKTVEILTGGERIAAGKRTLGKICLKSEDRRVHSITIGASGSGKSRLALHLASEGIKRGEGVGIVDPKGDLYQNLLQAIYHQVGRSPENLSEKYTLIDPTSGRLPGFNPLEVPNGEEPYPDCLDLMGVFEDQWEDFYGPRMADILRNSVLTLMENNLTMIEIPKLLTDPDFRNLLIKDVENERVKEFWEYRFNPLPNREKRTWIESTLNKVSEFIANPVIAGIVGQRHTTINFREILDGHGKLLVNLPKGALKEQCAHLLGALLVAKVNQVATERTDLPEEDRTLFHLFVDEFQNFSSGSFREVLAESRSAGLSLHMITQDFAGVEDDLQASIFANCKLLFSFRSSREDAELLAKHLFEASGQKVKFQLKKNMWGEPQTNPVYQSLQEEREEKINELVNLRPRQVYFKVRGSRRGPTLMRTLTTPDYDYERKEIEDFAKGIMEPYTKPEPEIRKILKERREQLEERIEEGVLQGEL